MFLEMLLLSNGSRNLEPLVNANEVSLQSAATAWPATRATAEANRVILSSFFMMFPLERVGGEL